ncbi:MAG: hypothetical protein ACLRME_10520 [Faecalibacterium prausnitzii]
MAVRPIAPQEARAESVRLAASRPACHRAEERPDHADALRRGGGNGACGPTRDAAR